MPMQPGELPRKKPGMSKTKLALGAAGLLLFIVGVRKTFRPEGGESFGTSEGGSSGADRKGERGA
jgi:hypothetical protein